MAYAPRLLCLAFFLFASLSGFSQEKILIPYKSGEKYGLCDEKALIVIPPVYDKVKYLEQHYFVFGNKVMQIDSVIDEDGQVFIKENVKWSFGLLKKDQLLIAPQEFENFIFDDHFIVLSESFYHSNNVYIYNLIGQKVYDELVNRWAFNDPEDLGALAENSERYTFLSLHHGEGKENSEKFSIAVYDNELQKIDSWLVKDVTEYKYHSDLSLPDLVYCTYKDNSGRFHEKFIREVDGHLELVDRKALSPEVRYQIEELKKEKEESDHYGGGSRNFDSNYELQMTMVERPERNEQNEQKKVHDEGHALIKDTLYFRRTGERDVPVKLQKNTELIFIYNTEQYQAGSVLYKKKDKYGLLIKGEYSKVLYDSLLYFGSNFIAGTKKGKKLRFGLIDGDGKVIIPIEYDSIPCEMKEFARNAVKKTAHGIEYAIQLQQRPLGYPYSGTWNPYVSRHTTGILVYKGAKCGVISETGNIIIPVEYDTISNNNFHFNFPKRGGYIILKKDGLYGVFQMNLDTVKGELYYELKPSIFPYVPADYRQFYYKTPGFRLYTLCDEKDGSFMGFANDNGVLYFKEE